MKDKFINNRNVSERTKIRVFCSIYRPILTFGCETWVLDNRQKSKIQASEMMYLRRIKGITRLDKIRNDSIREELETVSVLEFIERRQLSWWGHMMRMDQGRSTRRIWEAHILKNKKRGRPRVTWNETISAILKKRNKRWEEARGMALNRREWKSFVNL